MEHGGKTIKTQMETHELIITQNEERNRKHQIWAQEGGKHETWVHKTDNI